MGRWEPNARGRLVGAALDLFAERGYDQTTVLDIAQRAGVTERTFFRHFADKREALFGGSAVLQSAVTDAIGAAPTAAAPIDVVGEAVAASSAVLELQRGYARRRAAAIAGTPSLRERELLKLATLSRASAEALRARGVDALEAALAAETGVTAFKVGFDRWIASDDDTLTLEESIRDSLARLKALAAG
jgi:AcrR family transcriptional regulator